MKQCSKGRDLGNRLFFSCLSLCLSVYLSVKPLSDTGQELTSPTPTPTPRLTRMFLSLVLSWFSLVLARNSQGIEAGPDTNWTGLIFFVVGLSILACTERLATNVGLDDERGWGLQAAWCSSRSLSFNSCAWMHVLIRRVAISLSRLLIGRQE